ncbi:MAG: TRAP transporter small permease [Desulfobacteraceae bacterium]|nr:MAG: TRAP transporter small permease [Desulfobacteraceae bacterium]
MKGKSFLDRIMDTMAFIAGLLLTATVFIVSVEVFMRYFLRTPLVWSVEVCEYILFAIAFLGAPWLLKRGGHVNVDIVLVRLGQRMKNLLGLFASSIGVFVSAVIVWFSAVAAWECYTTGVVVTKTLTVEKYFFILLITLGYLVLMLEFVRQFYNNLRSRGN